MMCQLILKVITPTNGVKNSTVEFIYPFENKINLFGIFCKISHKVNRMKTFQMNTLHKLDAHR